MSDSRKIRMVRCTYLPHGKDWVPMGRDRTRCPKCGAEVGGPEAAVHPVQLREPGDG